MQTTLHTILYIAKVVRAMVDKYKKNIYSNYIIANENSPNRTTILI